MNKISEVLDLARTEYINGYEEKDTTIRPSKELLFPSFTILGCNFLFFV